MNENLINDDRKISSEITNSYFQKNIDQEISSDESEKFTSKKDEESNKAKSNQN
jgi:hypothetical protein